MSNNILALILLCISLVCHAYAPKTSAHAQRAALSVAEPEMPTDYLTGWFRTVHEECRLSLGQLYRRITYLHIVPPSEPKILLTLIGVHGSTVAVQEVTYDANWIPTSVLFKDKVHGKWIISSATGTEESRKLMATDVRGWSPTVEDGEACDKTYKRYSF